VHTALEERAPRFIESFEKDHGNDELVYAQLRKLSSEVGNASGERKSELGNEIYDIYNQFAGIYVEHLYRRSMNCSRHCGTTLPTRNLALSTEPCRPA